MEQMARKHGTPLYIYSAGHITERVALFRQAFGAIPHMLCYAVKANSSLAILQRCV